MKLRVKIATVLSILFACSTAVAHKLPKQVRPNVPLNALLSLRHGFTQQQVEDLLKIRGYHQFTAVLSNSTARCVTYFRNDVYGKYYLVFINERLVKICNPPPFELISEPLSGGGVCVFPVLGNPETRIDAVLQAEDLIGPKLTAALVPQTPPKQSVDWGLTAALVLTSLVLGNPSRDHKREHMYWALVEKFDPYKIALGSNRESVESHLGKPHIIESLDKDREMRYYGSIWFGLQWGRKLMWLSVVYENDKVVQVLSRDFVDFTFKIRSLDEKASPPEGY